MIPNDAILAAFQILPRRPSIAEIFASCGNFDNFR